ncbi:MAG TPA: restriction endonuclease [Lysobacter sp.]|nr:restriction endonuclease [Lysobacter sp.]
MPSASFLTTVLLIAVALGGIASAWLWLVYNQKQVTAGGLRALAAMRWRESSRFIIEALEDQGFTASRLSPDADRGQNADLLLNRGDQTWLLSCKQGVDYRVDASMVDQLSRAVRDSAASGGILATLGRIQADARKHHQGIELIDGATLWPLISPLLPPSLHRELVSRARTRTVRATLAAWLLALVVGVVVAAALAGLGTPSRAPAMPDMSHPTASSPPAAATPAASGQSTPAESLPLALSEEEQRDVVVRAVSALPGIHLASWATRSTLLVQVQADASQQQIDAVCAVLKRHETLSSSRVQLQPPPDSDVPVRFLQCAPY